MKEGLRMPTTLGVIVVTLLAYGCPTQAIVHAYGLHERTVATWRDRAGKQCQQVHEALVVQGHLDLQQVQADEIRVKGQRMMALMVSTRLWLGGVVSRERDRTLADRLLHQVRACCLPLRALLVYTDGWGAYPNSIMRAFRAKAKKSGGRGRACLEIWPDLCIATVIKRAEKQRFVEVTRKMILGALEQAKHTAAGNTGRSSAQHRVY
jgi:hypothetical protein